MTDKREWWEDPKEAVRIFGEWKEPEKVWKHHQIRNIQEPRREWWMGAPLAKNKWDKKREAEIRSQIELLTMWNKNKNTLAR